MANRLDKTIESLLPTVENFLCESIKIPSVSGHEHDIIAHYEKAFNDAIGNVQRVPISSDIVYDEDYYKLINDLNYDDRSNLLISLPAQGTGKSLIINTHMDIVPPSIGQKDPYKPFKKNGAIYGRGACDTKGQVATILLTLLLLREHNIHLNGNLNIHLVIEEEIGGNGTLSMIRKGYSSEAAIIMEPTDLKVFTAVRGSLWFKLNFQGESGHIGSPEENHSALEMAVLAMQIIHEYHKNLYEESKDTYPYANIRNSMGLNFGKLNSGNFPSTVPSSAVLEGVMGFLPNKKHDEIMREIRSALLARGGSDFNKNMVLTFTFAIDPVVIDEKSTFIKAFTEAYKETEPNPLISAATYCCDAIFYNRYLNIPILVFGPGEIKDAHSNHEKIKLNDICSGAKVLFSFIKKWCG